MKPVARRSSTFLAFLAVALLSFYASSARAQQAVVAVAQHITERKVGDANWTRAGKGTGLNANNRFRTGKRSKADLKFGDGSLIRLGQLSLLELRGAKNVRLVGGQLLFSMLKGGRVLAGSAAAAIKGSVGVIEVRDDNTALFTLYSGAMDVETPNEIVAVAPGTQVTVLPDGTISPARRVPILLYASLDGRGNLHPELSHAPVDAPFVGSEPHELTMYDPTRIALDAGIDFDHLGQATGPTLGFSPLNSQNAFPRIVPQVAPILNFYNPFGTPPVVLNTPAGTFSGTFGNGTYTVTQVNGATVNFPTLAFPGFPPGQNFTGTFNGNYVLAAPGQNAGQTVTFTQNTGAVSTLITFADPTARLAGFSYTSSNGTTQTGAFNPAIGPFARRAPLLANRTYDARAAAPTVVLNGNSGVSFSSGGSPTFFLQRSFGKKTRVAQLEETPKLPDAPAVEPAEESDDEPPIDLNLAAAYKHIEDTSTNKGRGRQGDFTVSGAYTDGGANVISAYLHGAATQDRLFLEGTLRPLRAEANNNSRDLSTISDLNLTLRDWRGEVQVGRQRFLRGPAQITLFGSLVRQGGREVMDAIRVAPDLGSRQKLEFAYLYDAFPRHLPYDIGGSQGGFYGRYSTHQHAGNFGLNLLRYNNSPVNTTIGYSLDFGVPIKRDEIELYGEIGRDTFRRRMTTVGLSFPGLYDRTDYDVYLEYSDLGNGSAPTPPAELAARVYKRINDNLSGVVAVSRFSGFDTKFTLGLAYGAVENSPFGR